MELKTLKDFGMVDINDGEYEDDTIVDKIDLKNEIIKIFKNLQSPETIYPLILNNFPEDCKGQIAKDKWNDAKFRYGTEYGMLSMLYWFLNLTKEDLK